MDLGRQYLFSWVTRPKIWTCTRGGIWSSKIFTTQLCQGISVNPCGSGGLFNPDSSETIDDKSIQFERGNSSVSSLRDDGVPVFAYTNRTHVLDQLQFPNLGVTVANHSITMYSKLQTVYPDGNYSLQLGILSLGPVFNQTFTAGSTAESSTGPSDNGTLIPGDLAAQNIIPSNSFGLHIGISALTPKLDLSLWFGGYDAARIVGPVSSQSTVNHNLAIELLDIGIGVDHGESPFSYSSQQGLLSGGNSSITSSGIAVIIDPTTPYLYLPNSTCTAIARNLPVTYNAGKALYIWNVTDPQYTKIITSPTYLNFVFRKSGGNITIKAPFQLFNLTLQHPLTSIDTPDFPCQPIQGSDNSYTLGRAFMQAAFVGVNWAIEGESAWFLAQAPGPKTNTEPQSRSFTDSNPAGYGQDWADSWKDFWTAIPSPTASSTTTSKSGGPASPSDSSTHHLTAGPIAGIALGVAFILDMAAGIYILLFRRRKRAVAPNAVPSIELNTSKKRIPSAVQPIKVGRGNTFIPSHPLFSQHEGAWSDSLRSVTGGRPSAEGSPATELSGENYGRPELP